jgi:hypothetical protein
MSFKEFYITESYWITKWSDKALEKYLKKYKVSEYIKKRIEEELRNRYLRFNLNKKGKENIYKLIQKDFSNKIDKFFNIDSEKIKYYTKQNVPKEIEKKVIETFNMLPPAYVDPNTLSIVMDLTFFNSLTNLKHTIAHELGHLLDIHFGNKISDGKTLTDLFKVNKGREYKINNKTIIISAVWPDEDIAEMFSKILNGISLDDREKMVMIQINKIINRNQINKIINRN